MAAFAGTQQMLNLSPSFFLKKIATFAASPYYKVGRCRLDR
jgi:hypothetical protein